MEKLTFGAVNTAIITGDFDTNLDQLLRTIHTRKEVLNLQFKSTLNIGDKVKFKDNTKPTYMRGMVATVISIKRERVGVRLEKAVGRFRGDLVTPVSLIEKV
jgi:hypothetical protein